MKALICLLPLLALAEPPKLRLPDTSKPLGYRIELSLDPSKEYYAGTVDVDIEILKPAKEIWLNVEGLQVRQASLENGPALKIVTQPHDFVGFEAAQELKPGKAKLHVEFTGKFDSKNSNGIFRMEEAGDWYSFTQFEPIAARAGFPCYDEPGFKVPWQLTLRVPRGMKAAANTPALEETSDGEWTRVRFAQSKPMPSYLVAFAVGPFEFVDAGTAGLKKTPLRIITPRGKAAEARYAVEITGMVLEELEAYFGIPYPYEKLDSIAIPLTFGFGAMENAGLITYARTLLLSPPDRESDSFKQGYLSVGAHEIAHQWFGNLVTPEYWDDIWLNEAFATWLEGKITAKMRPEWKREIRAVEQRDGAMGQDSLISARRIRQPIEHNGDIVNAFDGITYTKGAAVIGMFEKWMGEREFQEGVRRYMRQYAWRNATAGMFLDSISAPRGKNVSAAFNTFLNQAGVPLLKLSIKCEGGKATAVVRQERFLPVGSKGDSKQAWQLPVCLAFEEDGKPAKQCTLVTQPQQEVSLESKGCPVWVNGNGGAAGYYRVAYDGGALRQLVDQGTLSEAETIDLLSNTLALANAGKIQVSDALRLARRYASHPDMTVVERSFELVASLEGLVSDADRLVYARLVRDLFGALARKLGWTPGANATPLENEVRRTIVPGVAMLGEDEGLQQQALELGRRWLKDRGSMPTDIARSVMRVAASRGGETFYNEVLAALKSTRDRAERGVLISALSSTNDPSLTKRSFEMVLSRAVDFREGVPVLFGALRGARTQTMPYELVRSRFDDIMAIAPGGGSFNFGSNLPMAATGLCDASRVDEVRSFFGEKLKGVTGADRSLRNAAEAIELCSARKSALGPQVHAALQGQ